MCRGINFIIRIKERDEVMRFCFPLVEQLYHVLHFGSQHRCLQPGWGGRNPRAPTRPALPTGPRSQPGLPGPARPLCGTASAAAPSPGWEPPALQAPGRERPAGSASAPAGAATLTHPALTAALTAPTPPPPRRDRYHGAGPWRPGPPR